MKARHTATITNISRREFFVPALAAGWSLAPAALGAPAPLINRDAGRDHWPGAGALVLGGGGLRTGQVIGATSEKGEFVRSRPVDPGDLLATVYHVLGIDPRQVFLDNTGRPHPILTRGQAIAELI